MKSELKNVFVNNLIKKINSEKNNNKDIIKMKKFLLKIQFIMI